MNFILRIGLALGLFLLPALTAKAQTYCKVEVWERLDRLNVESSDIREITYDKQRAGSRSKSNRILAWVGLNSCKGYVIVDLSKHCTVREVYGRGECNLGGAVKPWQAAQTMDKAAIWRARPVVIVPAWRAPAPSAGAEAAPKAGLDKTAELAANSRV